MSSSQLQRAYELIKQGREQEAIELLEPLIRLNPENDDAWWLLANATDDPDAKRNALNKVIRLADNASRVQKAQQMLQILDSSQDDVLYDDFNSLPEADPFDAPAKRSGYAAPPQAPVIVKDRRGPSCFTGCLGVIGVLILLSCIGCFAIVATAPRFFDFLEIPTEYTDAGAIEPGQTVEGDLSSTSERLGYVYSARGAEELTIYLNTDRGDFPPMAFVYDMDSGELHFQDFSASGDSNMPGQAVFTASLDNAGQYLIVVRAWPIPWFDVGLDPFTLRVEN
ncbi:MAG: tetratricopeptide repeat protein [Anaerolineae bacterium]|nr:tetratricopeptide repeat protein [Anaerolineae bacterium]